MSIYKAIKTISLSDPSTPRMLWGIGRGHRTLPCNVFISAASNGSLVGDGRGSGSPAPSRRRRLLCLAEVAVISRYSDICHEYCMALLWLCLRALATTQLEKQSMPWIEANLDLWGIPEHVFCIFHVGRLTIYLCMSPIQ